VTQAQAYQYLLAHSHGLCPRGFESPTCQHSFCLFWQFFFVLESRFQKSGFRLPSTGKWKAYLSIQRDTRRGLFEQSTGGLVVRWMKYPLLYVFVHFAALAQGPRLVSRTRHIWANVWILASQRQLSIARPALSNTRSRHARMPSNPFVINTSQCSNNRIA
jgi:hypothetical protein